MITVFTPSFADEADTNAQNLTVKEIVARLSPKEFRVVMLHEETPDPRIAGRQNTTLLRWHRRGNTLRILLHCLGNVPDVYFFPREGPLDAAFLAMRRRLALKTAVVTYIVSGGLYNPDPPRPALARNVREADIVFGNCQFLSKLVQKRMGVEAGVRYDGIDRRFFFAARELGTSNHKVRVLFAGSLRPYKRADLVIRQAARWPTIEFRIAGRGEEEQRDASSRHLFLSQRRGRPSPGPGTGRRMCASVNRDECLPARVCDRWQDGVCRELRRRTR
jgi:glycosyltransferase involved in cell wall biosynthesis